MKKNQDMQYPNIDLLNKCIGYAVAILRNNQCMTGKQLGISIGVSQQQISRYETGFTSMKMDTCYLILQTLQVSINEFLSLVDQLYVNNSSNFSDDM